MTAIEDSDIFEVSTPELHDVVRLEDRYGQGRQEREIASSDRRSRVAGLRLRICNLKSAICNSIV